MLNVITVMGRITKPLELKKTPSGVSMLDFSIANDEDYTPKDGGERKTNFINVRAWTHTAEFISRNFDKGRMIAIQGRMQVDNYTDKEGNKKTFTFIKVDNAYFADSKRDSSNNQSANSYSSNGAVNVSADGFRELDDADSGTLPF